MADDKKQQIASNIDFIELIQHSKFFSGISKEACQKLAHHLQAITLDQGEILFRQGDPSDALFIVIDGQLVAQLEGAHHKTKIVGTIEHGETVGELGTLSSQPRSLTVRATVKSHLLKLPRNEFQAFCKEEPGFILGIIELIIARSQNTLKLFSQKKLYKHIAIVAGNERTPIAEFMTHIKANFIPDNNFIFLDTDPEHIAKEIDNSEHENRTVIFKLDQNNIDALQTKLTHIDGIFIVVDGDYPTLLSDFALSLLNKQKTSLTTRYELVLLHDDQVTAPHDTNEWLKQGEFTLHHHMHMTKHTDYQRLIRFMKGQAIGVVFGGGGVKGWVCIGAIKAMLEKNITIDAIGGTSIGSAVAACYAFSLNYDECYDLFHQIMEPLQHTVSIKDLTWPLISIVSTRKSTAKLQELFQNTLIENLWIPYFAAACNLSAHKEAILRHGLLWEAIRASSAIPGLAPPMVINGELHFDGGLLNNLPVDYMRVLLGDESKIYAVSLAYGETLQENYNFPPALPFRIGLLTKLKMGYEDYKFPPFFHTFVQAMLIGSSSVERKNQTLADVLVCPDVSKYRSLKMNLKSAQELIDIGYKAMLDQIEKLGKE